MKNEAKVNPKVIIPKGYQCCHLNYIGVFSAKVDHLLENSEKKLILFHILPMALIWQMTLKPINFTSILFRVMISLYSLFKARHYLDKYQSSSNRKMFYLENKSVSV